MVHTGFPDQNRKNQKMMLLCRADAGKISEPERRKKDHAR
jgi:hypothetical protein